MFALARVLSALTLDLLLVFTIAWMMWWNAGETVADLPAFALVMTILLAATVVTLRVFVVGSTTDNRGISIAVTVGDCLLLAGLTAMWYVTGSYLAGWFATCAALALFVAGVIEVMTVAASRHLAPRRGRASATLTAGILAVTVAACGVFGVVLTAPVHGWVPRVINVTILVIAAAIAAAWGVRRVLLRSIQPVSHEADQTTPAGV